MWISMEGRTLLLNDEFATQLSSSLTAGHNPWQFNFLRCPTTAESIACQLYSCTKTPFPGWGYVPYQITSSFWGDHWVHSGRVWRLFSSASCRMEHKVEAVCTPRNSMGYTPFSSSTGSWKRAMFSSTLRCCQTGSQKKLGPHCCQRQIRISSKVWKQKPSLSKAAVPSLLCLRSSRSTSLYTTLSSALTPDFFQLYELNWLPDSLIVAQISLPLTADIYIKRSKRHWK